MQSKQRNEEVFSAEQIIAQIARTLAEADGELIEHIANLVLAENIVYIGDSLFGKITEKG